MNCPNCNFKTGILGVMLSETMVARGGQKDGDIYVCPMCSEVSIIHSGDLRKPAEDEKGKLEIPEVLEMIKYVQELYRLHRQEREKVN